MRKGSVMKLTRREFLMVGASLALAGCGGGSDDAADEVKEEEEAAPEPIVTETTN